MPEEQEDRRRSSSRRDRGKVPSWIAEHGLEWAMGAAIAAIIAGILAWGDARYWLRYEEEAKEYKETLMEIDDELKDERRQIRIWTNYNIETPTSSMVGARNRNIADAELIIVDLVAERDRKVKEWESEQ